MSDTMTVRDFIEKHFFSGHSLKSDQEPLFTSGAIDSFGVLELIAFLEKRFGILIDTQVHELKEFDTVQSIMHVVAGLKKN